MLRRPIRPEHSLGEFVVPLQLVLELMLYRNLAEVDLFHELDNLFRQFLFSQVTVFAVPILRSPAPVVDILGDSAIFPLLVLFLGRYAGTAQAACHEFREYEFVALPLDIVAF